MSRDPGHAIFLKIFKRHHVGTVPGNMLVKFGVGSIRHFNNVVQTHTHQMKTLSPCSLHSLGHGNNSILLIF